MATFLCALAAVHTGSGSDLLQSLAYQTVVPAAAEDDLKSPGGDAAFLDSSFGLDSPRFCLVNSSKSKISAADDFLVMEKVAEAHGGGVAS